MLNLYIWSDYLAPNTLSDFEKQTGIKVHVAYFDTNETLETKLLAGSSGYDVVVPTASYFERQIKAGVYLPLDKSKLPNLKNMDPQLMARVARHDPGNAHGVIYIWGTNGIGYNEKMVKELMPDAPLDSWRLVFDPAVASKIAKCGISVLDSPAEMMRVVLSYLGKDPNSQKPEDLAAAEAVLLKIRPYIRNINSSEYIEALANGDLCVAVGYNGDVLQARDRAREANKGIEIKYMVPKEGSILWFDMLAIPKDAPDPESAYAFLNYIMTPQGDRRYLRISSATPMPMPPRRRWCCPPSRTIRGSIRRRNAPEAGRAARRLARADPRHHPHLAKVQDGPIAHGEIRRSRVKAAPWNDPTARPYVQIERITKSFGDFKAVDDVSLKIYQGEIFCLLGASGCGKTTLLRMLGGFETPSSGRILIDGEDMTGVPPYERPVNMMFQSYALFPHMNVEQNVAFGLKQDRVPKAEIAERVATMLDLVKLGGFAKRKPHQLSGGQRSAWRWPARWSSGPKLLLLDEPLGALDKKLREHTQFELISLQDKLGVTFLVVTHDQEEAMTLASRIGVMDHGEIVQAGTPSEIYEFPVLEIRRRFRRLGEHVRGQAHRGRAGVRAHRLARNSAARSTSATASARRRKPSCGPRCGRRRSSCPPRRRRARTTWCAARCRTSPISATCRSIWSSCPPARWCASPSRTPRAMPKRSPGTSRCICPGMRRVRWW